MSSDETRDVSHVCKKISANIIANLSEALILKLSRVRAETSDNQLWFKNLSIFVQFVIVDKICHRINFVLK